MDYLNKNFPFFDLLRAGIPPRAYQMICTLLLALAKKHKDSFHLIAQQSNVHETLYPLIEELPIKSVIKNYVIEEYKRYQLQLPKQQLSQLLLLIAQIPECEYEKLVQKIKSTFMSKMDTHLQVPAVISTISMHYLQMQFDENGTFHDGTAGLGETALQFKQRFPDATVKLQEIDLYAASMLILHSYILNQPVEMEIGDIITNPLYIKEQNIERFDRVFMAPPFALRLTNEQQAMIEADPYNRFIFGNPHRTQSELAYVSCGLSALKEEGKAAFLLSAGALFRSGPEKAIRENLMHFDMIDIILLLPAIIPGVGINTVLVFCNKNKPKERKGKILMINAEALKQQQRSQVFVPEEKLLELLEIMEHYTEVESVSRSVNIDEIHEGILSPDKYVHSEKTFNSDFGEIEFSFEAIEQLETVRLKDIATIYRGYNALSRDEDTNGEYAILKIADISNGEITSENLVRYKIESEKKIASSRVQKDDLLLSIRGANRKFIVFNENRDDILISQNFAGIRCSAEWNPKFLAIYFESPIAQFYFEQHTIGSTILNLPIKDLEQMPIPRLSIEQQNQIVERFEREQATIAYKIAALEAERKASKLAAFKAMGLEKVFKISAEK